MDKVYAVAMSGGVDSSLTASMLLEQGYKVFGITLRLWVSDTEEDEIPQAVVDAKKMCDFLGIEHHVVDAKDIFKDNVVDYFITNIPMVVHRIHACSVIAILNSICYYNVPYP